MIYEEVREVRDHEDDEEFCVSTNLLVGGILVLQGGSCRMKQQVLETNRNDGIYEWTQTGRRRGRNRVQVALHVCVDRVHNQRVNNTERGRCVVCLCVVVAVCGVWCTAGTEMVPFAW